MLTNKQIENRIKKLEQIEAEAAKLKEQAEAIRNELKGELDSRKEDVIETGSHNVFYNIYSKKIADSAKLKKAGLYDQYSKESIVTQFKITTVKVV